MLCAKSASEVRAVFEKSLLELFVNARFITAYRVRTPHSAMSKGPVEIVKSDSLCPLNTRRPHPVT